MSVKLDLTDSELNLGRENFVEDEPLSRRSSFPHEATGLENKVLKGRHRNRGDDHPSTISVSSHWGVISRRSPVSIRSTYGGDGAESEQESPGEKRIQIRWGLYMFACYYVALWQRHGTVNLLRQIVDGVLVPSIPVSIRCLYI